jgi:hypothetical protein
MTMSARKIEFTFEPSEKALDHADERIEAAKARRESELRVNESLQFERGYN